MDLENLPFGQCNVNAAGYVGMKEQVLESARLCLDEHGVDYLDLVRCEQRTVPESFGAADEPWVVEFRTDQRGAMLDPEHTVMVLVDAKTLEATLFPSL